MTSRDRAPLDGNAAAGTLTDIFSVDVTAALGQCVGCGAMNRLGEAGLYAQAPGMVLRCRGCDHVLVRVVTSADWLWLDLRGLTVLQAARPSGGAPPEA